MDMKKILQAVNGASSKKPVEGSDSMTKFLRVVSEADLNQSLKENIEDLGDGVKKKTNPDGTYEIGDGSGHKLYSADGKLLKYISPTFGGFNQETDQVTGNVTQNYNAGPLSMSNTKDKKGNVIKSKSSYDLGTGVVGHEQEKGITTKSWSPRSAEIDPVSQKDLYAMGNKDKEATYDRAMKQVKGTTEDVKMSKLLSIVTEGKGPLNRLTAAESMIMQEEDRKKTITSPVLNVSKDAKPSMIGKYFKAVETELAEASERSKNRARNLAERVTNKMETPKKSKAGISKNKETAFHAKLDKLVHNTFGKRDDELAEELNELLKLRNQIEEAIKQRLDPKCWKGKKIGNPKTKIKGGVRVNNCVPAEEAVQKTGPAGQLKGTDKIDVKGTVLGSPEKSQKGLRNKLVGGGSA